MGGGKDYLDMETAKKEISKYPVRYKNIEDYFINSDGIIDLMVENEIDAIKNFREDVFIRCGKNMKRPIIFRRRHDEANIFYHPSYIEKVCEGADPSVFHAHGIYPAIPSDNDYHAHNVMFSMGFQDGMILGIDGVYIQTFHGHVMKIPWSDEFYKRLEREGMTVIDDVKSVSCTRLTNSTKRECTIDVGNGFPKIHEIFDEVIYKEPSLDYYYSVLNDKYGSEKISRIDFSEKKTTCVISESQSLGKRFLSCFQRHV